jgi:hypothetical protein
VARSKAKPATNGEAPALRLEWRDPAELAENPRNWRRHPDAQLAVLSGVLAEVGWAGACLYNERTGRLIDGHARRKVALEQGSAKVPVLVGDWSEEQERKILATLDPLAAMATADAAFTVRVFLKDADDLATFGRLLGKDLTGRKFVWFGKQPQGTTYEATDGPTP